MTFPHLLQPARGHAGGEVLAAVSAISFCFSLAEESLKIASAGSSLRIAGGATAHWISALSQEQAGRFLKHFDIRALLFAKFVVGARQFMAPVAGMLRLMLSGSSPWTFSALPVGVTAITLLGYFARRYAASLIHVFVQFKALAAFTLLLLSVGFVVWRAWNFHRYGAARLRRAARRGSGE